MEELRTTEALDREILEDARKKAHKILKTADETLSAQTLEWEKKTSSALVSLRNANEEKQKKVHEGIFARFPLDKRRLRSENSENFLVKAMDDFLHSLSRDKLLLVLKNELLERLAAVNDVMRNIEIRYSGMSLAEAKQIFEKAVLTETFVETPFAKTPFIDASNDGHNKDFPFIEINAQGIKITASVESAAAALLKDKRAELALALLGEGVLND